MSAVTGSAPKVMKHNPSFLAPEELRASFVVRSTELAVITEAIANNTRALNQHLLIVGGRGAGKTTLIKRVELELRANSSLRERFVPLVLGEEAYDVTTVGELWASALARLAANTGDVRFAEALEAARAAPDERSLRERALARLRAFADERGVRLVVFVENLDMLVGEQLDADDAWTLRHTLQNDPRIILIASATRITDSFRKSAHPLYQQFRIVELRPLDANACRTLWARITGEDLPGPAIRPIEILTGGNPRLVSILGLFAARRSFRELMGDLEHLVDDLTTYFKANIEALPPLERKVFSAVAELWVPATAREVATRTRLDINRASALLSRLAGRSMVVEAEPGPGKRRYAVAERLYNLYYLMRHGDEKDRVRAVVHFLSFAPIYQAEPLDLVRDIVAEAVGVAEPQRQAHLLALDQVARLATEHEREQIAAAIPDGLMAEAPDGVLAATHRRVRLRTALEKAWQRVSRESLEDVRAAAGSELAQWESTVREALRTEPDVLSAAFFAWLLDDAGRTADAEALLAGCAAALQGAARAEVLLTHAQLVMRAPGRNAGALALVDEADALAGADHWHAKLVRARVLAADHQHAAAQRLLMDAVAQRKDVASIWSALAESQEALGELDAAARSARQVVALGGNAMDHVRLAELLARIGQGAEAERVLEAITLTDRDRWLFSKIARCWEALGRHAQAAAVWESVASTVDARFRAGPLGHAVHQWALASNSDAVRRVARELVGDARKPTNLVLAALALALVGDHRSLDLLVEAHAAERSSFTALLLIGTALSSGQIATAQAVLRDERTEVATAASATPWRAGARPTDAHAAQWVEVCVSLAAQGYAADALAGVRRWVPGDTLLPLVVALEGMAGVHSELPSREVAEIAADLRAEMERRRASHPGEDLVAPTVSATVLVDKARSPGTGAGRHTRRRPRR